MSSSSPLKDLGLFRYACPITASLFSAQHNPLQEPPRTEMHLSPAESLFRTPPTARAVMGLRRQAGARLRGRRDRRGAHVRGRRAKGFGADGWRPAPDLHAGPCQGEVSLQKPGLKLPHNCVGVAEVHCRADCIVVCDTALLPMS